MSWGGIRENAGRPAEFDERVSRVFYLDRSELEEIQHWIEFTNEASDKKLGLSAITRQLLLEWVEQQREMFKEHAKRRDSEVP
jgi:hypothetical protein